MSNSGKIFKCDQCGLVVEVLGSSKGVPACCDQEMEVLEEQTLEMGNEKHRPVIDGSEVKVGEVPHPMEDSHYIQWIQVEDDQGVCRKYLKPGDSPEAKFCLKDISRARIYCNIHGLWKN
ncbi:MAG: Desulfoferrodoxin [candidate division WS2 bacterium ADurb.Bin280]|uniref:Desulfoferrodoxin n=1 Tax=candidate division WS2 bacterium ADurb.Bin280 TaxID=1852829 RepID=A0A1V5SDY2_9BACT|nr:MAG: Desulfoferrodoxin [candidate division WS2 bacterium ADurb.Bin280]